MTIMDSDVVDLSEDILDVAGKSLNALIPERSKDRYQKAYDAFKQWQSANQTELVDENTLLAYFAELSKKRSPSSLWVYYSMLRSTIIANENVDIKAFQKLYGFVKQQNVGNVVKKSRVLSDDQLRKFLIEARDDEYLMAKVVTIFGLFGACRCEEIYNLAVDDVKIEGSVLIVTLNKNKHYKPRFFTVVSDGLVNQVEIVKKYMSLRPVATPNDHFFISYNKGKCSTQRVGIHKISGVPKLIANFLGLPNPEEYTGQCLRRTSATILASIGGNVGDLKRLGGWRSSAAAGSFIEESVQTKIRLARRMVGSERQDVLQHNSAMTQSGPHIKEEITIKNEIVVPEQEASLSQGQSQSPLRLDEDTSENDDEEPIFQQQPKRKSSNYREFKTYKQSRMDDIDEDKTFLLSLVPSFRKLTDDQKLEAKMEFLKVIRRISQPQRHAQCSNVYFPEHFLSHKIGFSTDVRNSAGNTPAQSENSRSDYISSDHSDLCDAS